MKMELTRDANNKVVGYKLIKEDTDDVETFERVRDMYFWNLEQEVIVYNGRKSDDDDNTTELKFATKAHRKEEMDKINNF